MRFPKPLEIYELFDCFGANILTTDFGEWKRHRRIVAPAFSEVRDYCRALWHGGDGPTDDLQKNNKLTFEESVRAITSLYDGGWRDKQEVIVDDVLSLTMSVSSGARLSVVRRL